MTDQNKTDLDSVMRRIQKLLAIAEDTRANANEAAVAAAQAAKLMQKYQIDHADVVKKDLTRPDAFETLDASVIMKKGMSHRPKLVPKWGQWLAVEIAKLNDCHVRLGYSAAHGAVVRFFGYKSDVQVAGWMFDYLVDTTIRGIRQYQKEGYRSKADSEDFRKGFVQAICWTIAKAIKEKDEMMKATSSSRELVLVKTQAVVEHFGEFKYNDKAKSKVNYHSDAYRNGVAKGAQVRLSTGGITDDTSNKGALRLGQ